MATAPALRPVKQPREDAALWAICVRHSQPLSGIAAHRAEPLYGPNLLWALAGLESDWGRQRLFVRHEAPYMPGGKYHKAEHLRRLWRHHGILAASSLGTWQMLAVVAWELGFRGHPIELQQDETCAHWAATLIEKRLVARQGATTLAQILDAYNTGTHRDLMVPRAYVDQGIVYYESAQRMPPPEAQEDT